MDSNNNIDNRDPGLNDFQEQVSEVLVRHRSILDTMTKLDEFSARINRSVIKSVTSCGCISIDAQKQDFGSESFESMIDKVDNHVKGHVCPNCKDIIEEEIGSYLFYLAALANALDLDLSSILLKEYNRIKTLGIYSLK
jgi:hypothetical protein